MLSIFCCLFLFLGQSLASPSGNQYVDTVIYSTLQNVIKNRGLEPAHLYDYTFDYKDKTIFGTVKGKAQYSEGALNGLSKIRRIGNCDGPRNVSQITYVNCTLSLDNLEATYKGKVKYGVLPKVTIHAKGNMTNIIFNIAIAKGFADSYARLNSFEIPSYVKMTTDFTGLGPLNKHMKVLEENYKDHVRHEVFDVVKNGFRSALNVAVGEVPMPVQ